MVDLPTATEIISTATSLDELEGMFPELCRALGLSHIAYHSLRASPIEPQRPVLMYTYEKQWVDRYFVERYFDVDPVISFGRRSFLPLDWASLPRGDAKVADFFRDSERYGVGRHGMTIPIHGPFGERALFTLNSTASERLWERTRARLRPHLLTLGDLIHERAMRLARARQDSPPKLSHRELQCLRLAAAGKVQKAIAFDLGISLPTVTGYIVSARQKLNAATTAQAVATAVIMDLL